MSDIRKFNRFGVSQDHMNNALKPVAIVVSFTTSPTRLHKCRPVIDSLLNQTRRPDEIRLNLPSRFERTGEEYPTDEALPDWLIGNSLVKIQRCDRDWGPATKIVPTVIQLQQKNLCSIIISVDDDIRYPSGAVSALVAAAIPWQSGSPTTKSGVRRDSISSMHDCVP